MVWQIINHSLAHFNLHSVKFCVSLGSAQTVPYHAMLSWKSLGMRTNHLNVFTAYDSDSDPYPSLSLSRREPLESTQ